MPTYEKGGGVTGTYKETSKPNSPPSAHARKEKTGGDGGGVLRCP